LENYLKLLADLEMINERKKIVRGELNYLNTQEGKIKESLAKLKKIRNEYLKIGGIEEKVFIYHFMDGLKIKQVAKRLPADYTYVAKIVKKIKRKALD